MDPLVLVPEACIEECGCEPVKDTKKMTYKVCGSDGVNYENLCKLICRNCENNVTLNTRYFNASQIRFAYKDCDRANDTPPLFKKLFRPKTPKPTGSTTTKITKPPKSTTPKPTPPPYTGPPTTEGPACDKDALATIKVAESQRNVVFKNLTFPISFYHLGECVKGRRKRSLDPHTRKECRYLCATCSNDRIPVCGTNGRTFKNECRLRCEDCVYKQGLQVAYRGRCIPPPRKLKRKYYDFSQKYTSF